MRLGGALPCSSTPALAVTDSLDSAAPESPSPPSFNISSSIFSHFCLQGEQEDSPLLPDRVRAGTRRCQEACRGGDPGGPPGWLPHHYIYDLSTSAATPSVSASQHASPGLFHPLQLWLCTLLTIPKPFSSTRDSPLKSLWRSSGGVIKYLPPVQQESPRSTDHSFPLAALGPTAPQPGQALCVWSDLLSAP